MGSLEIKKGFKSKGAIMSKTSPKQHLAASMFAIGSSMELIMKATGFTEDTIRQYSNEAWFLEIVRNVQKNMEVDYENLWFKAIKTLQDCMEFPDPSVRMAAANLYGKFSGRFSEKVKVEVGAEDIVKMLIEGTSQPKADNNKVHETDNDKVHEVEDNDKGNGSKGESALSGGWDNRKALPHSE